MTIQKITPCLWFDNQIEEAVKLYTAIFPNSKIGTITHYDEASAKVSGQLAGSILTIEFELAGQKFMGLNGGPIFKFTEAISFVIDCKDQEEVDYYWNALIAGGGHEVECGWLKDKFGLCWQVTPTILPELLSSPDKAKASRVMQAMLKMKKISIADLEKAANAV